MPKRPAPLDLDLHIGTAMMRIRLQRKMSRGELGKAIDVSFQQVSKYENGSNRITSGKLLQAAQVLGVSIEEFFSEAEAALNLDRAGYDATAILPLTDVFGSAYSRFAAAVTALASRPDAIRVLVEAAEAMSGPVAETHGCANRPRQTAVDDTAHVGA